MEWIDVEMNWNEGIGEGSMVAGAREVRKKKKRRKGKRKECRGFGGGSPDPAETGSTHSLTSLGLFASLPQLPLLSLQSGCPSFCLSAVLSTLCITVKQA